jgi:hypothetical protein
MQSHTQHLRDVADLAALEAQGWTDRLAALVESGVPLNATVTGARGTASIGSFQRKIDMESAILMLEPDAAPLVTLTGQRISRKPTHNPEYSWVEDELAPRFDVVNGTTGTGTSVIVTNYDRFAEHDLIKVTRTGEIMRVTAVTSGTATLTVVRGVGGSAVALLATDELLIIGSAQPEGDTSKPARSSNPVKVTNYTQIWRTPWESTETLLHSDTFTEPADWDYQANVHGIEHAKSQEYTMWHGRPSENLTGSQPRRTTGGVFYYITTNVTDAGGTLTEAEFWAALRPAMRYGAKLKTLFASDLGANVLNQFPMGKLHVLQGEDTYGLDVRRFISPSGRVNVVTNYLFEGAVYGGYMAVLDLSQIKKRYLANSRGSRDTHVKDGIQAPDAETMKSEYRTEAGLEFGLEKTHALITGITG